MWPPEIMTVPLKCMAASAPLDLQYALNRNICQIHCKYAIHDCKCCSEIIQYPLRSEWSQLICERKKHFILEKTVKH